MIEGFAQNLNPEKPLRKFSYLRVKINEDSQDQYLGLICLKF